MSQLATAPREPASHRGRRPLPDDRRELLTLDPDRGLSTDEARDRLARFGPNDVLEQRQSAWRELASDTARDPMLWFLLATSGLYALLGEIAEASVLLASVVPLVAMDFVLHRRTRASTQGLRTRLAATATVIRDGRAHEVPADRIVPGDLALVAPGAAFPSDGIIVAGEALQADESALTGEAHPVGKRPLPGAALAASPPALDLAHWGFAGTRLLTGTARVRVVLTGRETLYGEILRSAESGAHARTPLQRAVSGLVRALLVVAALLCLVLAWVRLLQGFGWVDALVSALTLAVAALPEEFPVVLTMFLGVGVYRLARRKALVRRSVSVENIGRVTCICSDKTGTLTLGSLRLAHRLPDEGATPESLLRSAALASRAESGDPLDVAILAASSGAGATQRLTVATFPFTEDRRRETAVVRRESAALLAVTKGAPEVVLALCQMPPPERELWSGRVSQLAAEGHKVLACAARDLTDASWAGGEPDRSFRFEGLLAFEDPVREGVADSVRQCLETGIRVLMVTGDHPATAAAVGREIGLATGEVVTGDVVEALVARGDPTALTGIAIVARAFPAQKLALVRALQAAGEIVAVTGDGVNDVPALQAADVGIAMGERGTRSAREAAAIVLLDDDFRTIVGAIAEGRQLFRNLQNSFRYLLTIHIPLVVTAALIPLAGFPLLFLPIHIVWLELIIHPSALLAFQGPTPRGGLAQLDRTRSGSFFSPREWVRIAAVGVLLTFALVAGYAMNLSGGVEHARAAALVVLSTASALVTALLSGLRTLAARIVSAAAVAVAATLVQTPTLAARLHLAPLHGIDWAVAVLGAIIACVPFLGRARQALAGRSPSQVAVDLR